MCVLNRAERVCPERDGMAIIKYIYISWKLLNVLFLPKHQTITFNLDSVVKSGPCVIKSKSS